MPKEPCNTGISTELIPNANPMAKNMMPINANGRAKFFLSRAHKIGVLRLVKSVFYYKKEGGVITRYR